MLSGLVAELGTFGLFVTDSAFSHRTKPRELGTVKPRLAVPGAVVADDVERSGAFAAWLRESEPT